MTRRLSPREVEEAYRWLMRSPRNRKLEILIILACMCWFLMFWLIDRIIESRSRSRHAPGVVGSSRGGPDDEGAKADKTVLVDDCSPPRSGRPFPFPLVQGEACNPLLAVRRRKR